MTDKEKKNKIVDILLDFYDEYQSNEINRPMIPSIYAGKILDTLQVEKELELTWEDIVEIDKLLIDLGMMFPVKSTPAYYDEVLKRFKEMKEK